MFYFAKTYFHKSGAKIQTFYKIAMAFSANFQRIIQFKILNQDLNLRHYQ